MWLTHVFDFLLAIVLDRIPSLGQVFCERWSSSMACPKVSPGNQITKSYIHFRVGNKCKPVSFYLSMDLIGYTSCFHDLDDFVLDSRWLRQGSCFDVTALTF